MIHVVGGTYLERCLEPSWNELYGSGGRAAAALSRLNDDVKLTTYIGNRELEDLEIAATTFNYEPHTITIPQTIAFEYYHPLSVPKIRPSPTKIVKAENISVEDKNILRFGFMEGDAVVHGENVVYDPQNARQPRLFSENGSRAGRLAIVANSGECAKLTGSSHEWYEAERLGKKLLEIEEAEVVVVKCGSLGATVVTARECQNIPVFRTSKVWSIGSGDVFASVFAHFWTSGDGDAFTAAYRASLATAYYCESKQLPIPAEIFGSFNPQAVVRNNEFPISPKRVYLAGPFFTMAERWIINEARRYLFEQGFKVFSPLHDVGFGTAEEVVPADIEGLDQSDVVFAILDGLDAGTLFEIGYARAHRKPVVVFVQNENANDLKMMAGTGCEIVKDFVSAIYRTVWAAMQL